MRCFQFSNGYRTRTAELQGPAARGPDHGSVDPGLFGPRADVGDRAGRQVRFVKTYDELHRAESPVHYEGQVSEDGDEITGRWTISDSWSGGFMMVRASGRAETVERVVAETVD